MTAISFDSAEELAKHVTDQAIPQADIVAINFGRGNRWWLFHF